MPTVLSEAVHAIYRQRTRVALSILLQFAGWIASGLWLWVVLAVMDIHPDLWSAIAIQALVEGLRSATVFIPAAIGIQEAGYAAVAPVFGLPPEIGLAVSLLRRARDILVAVPVLLIWQLIETRQAPAAANRIAILSSSIARAASAKIAPWIGVDDHRHEARRWRPFCWCWR